MNNTASRSDVTSLMVLLFTWAMLGATWYSIATYDPPFQMRRSDWYRMLSSRHGDWEVFGARAQGKVAMKIKGGPPNLVALSHRWRVARTGQIRVVVFVNLQSFNDPFSVLAARELAQVLAASGNRYSVGVLPYWENHEVAEVCPECGDVSWLYRAPLWLYVGPDGVIKTREFLPSQNDAAVEWALNQIDSER